MTRLFEVMINGFNLWGTGTAKQPIIQNLGLTIDSVANLKEYSLTTGGSTLKWLPDKSKKISFSSIITINGQNAFDPFPTNYNKEKEQVSNPGKSVDNLGLTILKRFKELAKYCIINDVNVEVHLADLNKTKTTTKVWPDATTKFRLTDFSYKFTLEGTVELDWEFTENVEFKAITKTFNSFNYKASSGSSAAGCGKYGWDTQAHMNIGTCLPNLWNKGKFYYGNSKSTCKSTKCNKCAAYWQYYIVTSYYDKKYKGLCKHTDGVCKKLNHGSHRIDGWWHNYTQKATTNKLTALYKKNKSTWNKLWTKIKNRAKKKDTSAINFMKFLGSGYKGTTTQKYFILYAYHFSLKYCKGCTIANGGYKKLKCKTTTATSKTTIPTKNIPFKPNPNVKNPLA